MSLYLLYNLRRHHKYDEFLEEHNLGLQIVWVSNIVGGMREDFTFKNPKDPNTVDYFVKTIKQIGYWRFETECVSGPVQLLRTSWNGAYYVASDGHHRVAAYKKIGQSKCLAEVTSVKPKEGCSKAKLKDIFNSPVIDIDF